MHIGLSLTLLCAIGVVVAQDQNCNFGTTVQINRNYEVYSPNYPYSYPQGVQCRWIATCPTGYNCVLDCTDVALPQTNGCYLDRLLISKSGDDQLTAADYYCGTGTVRAVSTGTRISLALITARNSPGGRFYCRLYAQPATTTPQPCSCGYKRSNRIVGGQETGVNEYPMMAGIADSRIGQIKCGATIISNRYVVTAAHCLDNQNIEQLAIVAGEHDVSTGLDTNITQVFRIINAVVHPSYTSTNYDYDIAILTTDRNIVFSDRVGPVCLPFKFRDTDFTNYKLTILGWGTLFIGGPTSDVLRKVDVDVMSQATCRSRVSTLTARQICTYTPGKDACQDDSGGPLLYTDPATGLLFNIGIVSFGRFCATQGQPGVNMRITPALDWIQANTPLTERFCSK